MKTQFTCRLETLTPVHVGDGKNYMPGVDFEIYNNYLTVYNMPRLLKTIENAGPSVQKEFEDMFKNNRPSLFKFFKSSGLNSRDFVRYRLPVDTDRLREVKAQFKSGFGLPLVPGSSFKGALRTVLWPYFVRQFKDRVKLERLIADAADVKRPQFADNRIEELFFGGDPQKDWLRVLGVQDVAFDRDDLDLFQVKILSLTQNGFGFKILGKERKNLPLTQAKQATTIVLEAIPANRTSADFVLSWDDFLRKHNAFIADKTLSLPAPEEFFSMVHNHFRNLAQKELQFFEKIGFKAAAQIYRRKIVDKTFEQNEYLIRLSWGGGWHFMTGDWLTDKQKEKLRRIIGIKNHVPAKDFPKTRRLAVENGIPCIPLGWVKVVVKQV